MLFDAIFQLILHTPPLTIFVGMLILAAVVGFASSLIVPVFFQAMENTRAGKARRRRDVNADLQRRYEQTCAQLVEMTEAHDSAARENIRLVGLLREERNHNVSWDRRADLALTKGSDA